MLLKTEYLKVILAIGKNGEMIRRARCLARLDDLVILISDICYVPA